MAAKQTHTRYLWSLSLLLCDLQIRWANAPQILLHDRSLSIAPITMLMIYIIAILVWPQHWGCRTIANIMWCGSFCLCSPWDLWFKMSGECAAELGLHSKKNSPGKDSHSSTWPFPRGLDTTTDLTWSTIAHKTQTQPHTPYIPERPDALPMAFTTSVTTYTSSKANDVQAEAGFGFRRSRVFRKVKDFSKSLVFVRLSLLLSRDVFENRLTL